MFCEHMKSIAFTHIRLHTLIFCEAACLQIFIYTFRREDPGRYVYEASNQ